MDYTWSISLLDELERLIGELSTTSKHIQAIQDHPTEWKLEQVERMQMLRKRVKYMLPDADAM